MIRSYYAAQFNPAISDFSSSFKDAHLIHKILQKTLNTRRLQLTHYIYAWGRIRDVFHQRLACRRTHATSSVSTAYLSLPTSFQGFSYTHVFYWFSFSNPRTRCIHCDNCLVIKKKCTLSFSLRSSRIYPPGCWHHRSVPTTLTPPPFQPIRAGSGDMY